ncbi:MAG: oxidoreductase [Magnetovibrio sp.]|nr:oxidoreductase [Magnetovibrio sp.]
MAQEPAWKGFRPFIVDRKVAESDIVTSFYLKPEDGDHLPPFRPGQFVNIKLDVPGQNTPILRSYTLSNSPANNDHYRLSIKRESPPTKAPHVPPGTSSNYLHDYVNMGSSILLAPPSGDFVLRPEAKGAVVFLAGGIGCTPLISMLTSIADTNSTRDVWFIHGSRNSREHAFGKHARLLANKNKNINVHIRYSKPGSGCRLGSDFDSSGHVDINLLQTLLPGTEPQFFLCGSIPFMRSLYQGLISWGVDPFQINYEFFGPATNLLEENTLSERVPTNTADSFEVIFQRSGKKANWSSASGSILELAEATNVNPDFICRSGMCQTCLSRVITGTYTYFKEGVIAPENTNDILICSSHPTSDIVLDI